MALHVAVPMRYLHERYFGRPSCAKCGELMMAPESSEHLNGNNIRHIWLCDGCDYRFETLIRFSGLRQYRVDGRLPMDKTVAKLNIEHYKKLASETDVAKRKSIARLLSEEEAKLAKIPKKTKTDLGLIDPFVPVRRVHVD